MKNFAILGLFAAAVFAIGGDRLRDNLRGLNSSNIVVSVSERSSGDDFNWSGMVRAGDLVEIKGINGDIHAEYTDGNEVRVFAVKDGNRSDIRDVTIQVVEHDAGVTLCAVYPNHGRERNRCAPGSDGHLSSNNNNTEVEFTVLVPRGVGFRANTVNGDVEAEGLTSIAIATTVNGDIVLSTTGYGEAETVNGDILAEVGEIGSGLNFQSVNGDLVVSLPAGIDAELIGETLSGDISSDFSVSIRGQFGSQNLRGILGDGGQRIQMESVNGDIRIIRH
jgi:DUF4097 and DUF4098 domain-containing protein YvlB